VQVGCLPVGRIGTIQSILVNPSRLRAAATAARKPLPAKATPRCIGVSHNLHGQRLDQR